MEMIQYLKLFFPSLDPKKEAEFLSTLENRVGDYSKESWSLVTKEMLKEDIVKLRLVRTIYQSQFGYDGVIGMIMDSLDWWREESKEGLGNYLLPDDESFYNLFYTYLGFTFFDEYDYRRQVYLLGTHFLVLAYTLDIDVFSSIQLHFSHFCDIFESHQDTILFVAALSNNPTIIGDEFGGIEIKKVIVEIDKFIRQGNNDGVSNLINNNEYLDENDKLILNNVLYLYQELKNDNIWKELSFNKAFHLKMKNFPSLKEEEIYLKLIEQIKDMNIWLNDYPEVVIWLKTKNFDQQVISKMFKIIKGKTDQTNFDQMSLVLNFFWELSNNGLWAKDVPLYYDEKAFQFYWSV